MSATACSAGLVPAAGASIAAITGVALSGLLYPMAIAALGVVVSLAFIREPTHQVRIWEEVGGARRHWCPTSPDRHRRTGWQWPS